MTELTHYHAESVLFHMYAFLWILFLLLSAYEGTSWPFTESESESESESVTMTVTELEPEPIPEPAPEPIPEPVVELIHEPAPESEPVSVKLCTCVRACGCVRAYLEPAPEPAHEPVVEPAPEPAHEPVVEPAPEPIGPPTAAHYRMTAGAVDHSKCLGRSLVAGDKRFRPTVFHEAQCGHSRVPNSDLCRHCLKRQKLFFEEGYFKHWNGLITEEPLDCCHMLGTQWASKVKWIG